MQRLVIFFILISVSISNGQIVGNDSIYAVKTNSIIKLDGLMKEVEWLDCKVISDFVQRDPNEGKIATEKTQIRILYNDKAIYMYLSCFDSDRRRERGKFMNRDFEYENDDYFGLIIDSRKDNRNGYMFVVNALGARYDALTGANLYDIYDSWNGVWDAKSIQTDDGWFVEIMIPFSTLQFSRDSLQFWGINFERFIASKLETDCWRGYSRDRTLTDLSQAGVLAGINGLKKNKIWEFKPYIFWGADKEYGSKFGLLKNLGLDINKELYGTLKLNMTINTDFAQVEADKMQINLTRFLQYYPEKRDFFLEGANFFEFKFGYFDRLFHSRVIGLREFEKVPVLGGARFFGQIGKTDIGVLNITTDSKHDIPVTNYSLCRVKQNIGERSYVGGMITSKIENNRSNQVYGLDAQYNTSKFLTTKSLSVTTSLSNSITSDSINIDNNAWRVAIEYPNDLMDITLVAEDLQRNFNPEMGFLQRNNLQMYIAKISITPRWFERYGMKKLYFVPMDFFWYENSETGEKEGYEYWLAPFGFENKNGDFFCVYLSQSEDKPKESFNLNSKIEIPAATYRMNAVYFLLQTYNGRRISTVTDYQYGTFYGGIIHTTNAQLNINFSKHFNSSLSYNYNYLQFDTIASETHNLSVYLNYAFSTKLYNTFYTQWNTDIQAIMLNFRLHWIPRIGSDFYIVFSQAYNHNFKPQNIDYFFGGSKLVYRLTF